MSSLSVAGVNRSTSLDSTLPYINVIPASTTRSARTARRVMVLNVLLLATNIIVHALNCMTLCPISLSSPSNDPIHCHFIDFYDVRVGETVVHHTLRHLFICCHSVYRTQVRHHDSQLPDHERRDGARALFSRVRLLLYHLSIQLTLPRCLRPWQRMPQFNQQSFSSSQQFPIPPLQTFYTSASSATAIPLIADKVSLPSIGERGSTIELSSVLPDSLARWYYDVHSLILPTSSVRTTGTAKSPSVHAASRLEYVKLLQRLMSLDMVTFTDSPVCINGLFGVKKDHDQIRLIVDATYANQLMIPPPPVMLPNPSHLSNIQSSAPFYTAKLDLSSYYHQLRMPLPLQPYFCLPRLSRNELRHLLSLSGQSASIRSNSARYPMLTTLPMGWSHSVYVAQSVHEHVLYTMSNAINPLSNILLQSALHRYSYLHMIYIDDVVILGCAESTVNEVIERVEEAYEMVGLRVNLKKKVAATSDPVPVIGVTTCGREQRLCVTSEQLTQLIHRTLSMLYVGTATSTELSRLVGSWVWLQLLRRPLLSIWRETYRFIQKFRRDSEENSKVLWSSIQRELALVCALAPTIFTDLSMSISRRVVATDASRIGYGVVANRTAQMNDAITSSVEQLVSLAAFGTSLCDSASFDSACDVLVPTDAHLMNYDVQQPIVALTRHDRTVLQSQLVNHTRQLVSSIDWSTIMYGKWRLNIDNVHINELELSALLLAVRWLRTLSGSRTDSRKVLMLVDNSTTLFSVVKGRSSSVPLLKLLRRITSIIVGMDLELQVIYVASAFNPADAASRMNIR